VWLGCAKQHVARADQLDLPLIWIRARRRAESTNQNEPCPFWGVRIGLSFDNMPIQNDDLALLKLCGLNRARKRKAVRLPFVVHVESLRAAGESTPRSRFAAANPRRQRNVRGSVTLGAPMAPATFASRSSPPLSPSFRL
jgi:hypothetical protein